ncbi:MAG: hypothetical protein JNM40_16085 [Myxococcales bacterium]|nr:hypothetical protein [Myxococcales bacterium]
MFWTLLVLGALVPHAAHALQAQCWIYLPVHIAPLLAGLALGQAAGLGVGIAVAISELLGSHLPFERLLPLACEVFAYGAAAGWLSRYGRGLGSLFLCLIGAQLVGRLAYLVPALVFGKPLLRALHGLFFAPWPGLLLQLTLLPPLALWLAQRVSPGPLPSKHSTAPTG